MTISQSYIPSSEIVLEIEYYVFIDLQAVHFSL